MRIRDITLDYEISLDIINSNEFRVRQLGLLLQRRSYARGCHLVIRCARAWQLDAKLLQNKPLFISYLKYIIQIILYNLYVTTNIMIIYIKYVIQCLNVMRLSSRQTQAGIHKPRKFPVCLDLLWAKIQRKTIPVRVKITV